MYHTLKKKKKKNPQWDATAHSWGWPLQKPQVTSVGEDVEKLEHLCPVGRKAVWWLLKKIELQYDPHPDIYPK